MSRGAWTSAAVAGGVLAAAGAGALAYGALVEARDFQIRRERLEIIPPGGRPLRILHLSDIHLMPTQFEKLEWLSTLHTLEPDLVVNTGDNIGAEQSVQPLLDALGPLLEVPGVFVPGSNDYYAPRRANPLGYLVGPSRQPARPPRELPWRELFEAFTQHGWIDLTNTHWSRVMEGVRLDLSLIHI